MGQAIIAEIEATDGMELSGGVERPGHPLCGASLGGDKVIGANAKPIAYLSDVLIDFTSPVALQENLDAALDANIGLVIGTTGLEDEDHAAIDKAARTIPILQAPNMSLGVNVLAMLVEKATRALGEDYDVEIWEMHHRHKVDPPSGTALFLGEAAARGRGRTLAELRLPDIREGARKRGGIGFAVLRGGSVAGDHRVLLAADGERLELGHVAESRTLFAKGAVTAAKWLASKPAGRYSMKDVVGFD